MKLLFKLLHIQRAWVLLTILFSIAAVTVTLWWNRYLSEMINRINYGKWLPVEMISKTLIIMLISMAAAFILTICSGWVCELLTHDLRMGYAKYFTSLPITEIENLNSGEQLSRLQNEIGDVSEFLHANLFPIVDDIIKFSATFSWMLWINPKLTLYSNLPVILILVYTVYSSKVIGQATQIRQQANSVMNGHADTLISIFPVLRMFQAEALIRQKYMGSLEKWENASIKEESRRAKLMSLSALLSCIPLLLLFLIGGIQIANQSTTIGILYIFINLSGNVSGVLMNMPGRLALLRQFLSNMGRLEPFVAIDKRYKGGIK